MLVSHTKAVKKNTHLNQTTLVLTPSTLTKKDAVDPSVTFEFLGFARTLGGPGAVFGGEMT